MNQLQMLIQTIDDLVLLKEFNDFVREIKGSLGTRFENYKKGIFCSAFELNRVVLDPILFSEFIRSRSDTFFNLFCYFENKPTNQILSHVLPEIEVNSD